MATTKCVVLDIETIPDHTVCLDQKGFEFPLPIFHKIVSISYAVLGNSFDLKDFKVLGLNEHTEEEALRLLGSEIDENTMVVTWSGRRFDVPVILYRSLKYKIQCGWHFKKDFDKRFGLTGHVDLQDHMMLFGAADKLKLDHAATLIGLPGKVGVKGSDVQELWARNQFQKIGAYNVSDVVELSVLFVRWAYLRGLATAQEVNDSLDSIYAYAKKPASGYPRATTLSVAEGINMVADNCDWESLKIK